MRKLLAIVVVVLIAMFCGWVTFNRTPGEASMTINTEKITDDARQAVEKGRNLLRSDGEAVGDSMTP